MRRLENLLTRGGPTLLAVVLALIAVAPVAWSLYEPLAAWKLDELDPSMAPLANRPMGVEQAILLAFATVIPAAMIGGVTGGTLRRGFPVGGAFTALSAAWLTGVVLLPLIANALAIPLTNGVGCFMSCEVHLRDDQPSSGAVAYVTSVGLSLPFIWFWLVPLIFLILALRWNTGDSVVPVFFAILLHAGLHSMAIIAGGAVPYVCLAVGVLAWSVILRMGDRRRRDAFLRTPGTHGFNKPTH
jgi:hypothetical protein